MKGKKTIKPGSILDDDKSKQRRHTKPLYATGMI